MGSGDTIPRRRYEIYNASKIPLCETMQPSDATAVDKSLRLLRQILEDRGRTSILQVAREAGLARSTVFRLVAALEDHGLVARVARGRYDAGYALSQAMAEVSPRGQLAAIARGPLRRLAVRCDAVAHLGIFENDMVSYLVRATGQARRARAAFTREDIQLEAYCSAIGKVLLAYLPAPVREQYLSSDSFVALTRRTITEPAKLRACLRTARSTGWACDDGEIFDELYCLAVPLAGEQVRAALSVSFPRGTSSQNAARARHLPAMQECAMQIAAKLAPSTPETPCLKKH